MSGHRPFSELTKDFTPERRQRIEAKKAELRAAMPLHELRQAQVMTQKALGETLAVNRQRPPSPMERRTDMYVSTLRSYIGRLKIVAEFPEGEVAITNFSDAGDGVELQDRE